MNPLSNAVTSIPKYANDGEALVLNDSTGAATASKQKHWHPDQQEYSSQNLNQ